MATLSQGKGLVGTQWKVQSPLKLVGILALEEVKCSLCCSEYMSLRFSLASVPVEGAPVRSSIRVTELQADGTLL